MFKVSKKEDIPALVKLYARLRLEAKKDHKPYILSCSAGPAYDDSRAQGYNFVAQSKFATKDDMDYYDNDCEAHKQLKAGLKGKVTPPALIVYYQDALVNVDVESDKPE
ncbi:MAG: hypothetical protein M1828_001584 [Chrysothrix sp. TS-e1954]|nr:MAG: hypothetical protein M1828_001584 [Chrysothrix sp. TS-e1954]